MQQHCTLWSSNFKRSLIETWGISVYFSLSCLKELCCKMIFILVSSPLWSNVSNVSDNWAILEKGLCWKRLLMPRLYSKQQQSTNGRARPQLRAPPNLNIRAPPPKLDNGLYHTISLSKIWDLSDRNKLAKLRRWGVSMSGAAKILALPELA